MFPTRSTKSLRELIVQELTRPLPDTDDIGSLPAGSRELGIWNNHRITPKRYNDIWIAQKGCCAICNRKGYGEDPVKLVIDHCHEQGEIRGLLCSRCNVSLGQMGDRYDTVLPALRYLAKAEGVPPAIVDAVLVILKNTKADKSSARWRVQWIRGNGRPDAKIFDSEGDAMKFVSRMRILNKSKLKSVGVV